jgi:hypothetical protein
VFSLSKFVIDGSSDHLITSRTDSKCSPSYVKNHNASNEIKMIPQT